ncbi:glycosyl hydrolase family 28-related protein [Dactylosporangium sp. CA-052675]|uniref:glycosyl hydrolase family 28-related protein n=1 Tax=Dactylosporangium sp. CA-052675 TaxID=3239927 RepID=UPI003D8A34BD
MIQDGPDRRPAPPVVSRRAALAGGALAAAASAAAAGAVVRHDNASPAPARTTEAAFNVRDFGAAGDGRADDTAKVQAAIDAARATGGIVQFPPGTFLTRKLTLYSRIHLRGSGGDATVLKLWPGAGSAILESDGFDRLTGGNTDGGTTLFSVRDLTLDGNKAKNPGGGYGLRLYGYGYELSDIIVFNCRNDGIFTEWGTSSALPAPSHQMEARLSGIRSHDNDGHGVNFNGPHDSMFLNCLTFQNGGTGFRITGNSAGTLMVNCHAWGIDQDISFDLAAGHISCMNCYADLNGGVGVRISRNGVRWIGGMVLGYNFAGPGTEIGVQFVAGPRAGEPTGGIVDTKIVNCGTAAVDFAGDQGASNIRASLSQPGVRDKDGRLRPNSGLGWIGTPNVSSQIELTNGLGNTTKNLVVRPAFDLRAQATPPPPDPGAVRVFARTEGGKTQLCALFPGGAVQVMATEP